MKSAWLPNVFGPGEGSSMQVVIPHLPERGEKEGVSWQVQPDFGCGGGTMSCDEFMRDRDWELFLLVAWNTAALLQKI
jgi:hypothetical protein